MNTRFLTFALFVALLVPAARAQEAGRAEPQAKAEARQRDEAAAKEALDGWWTAALKTRDQRLEWFRDAKFGCFIHWRLR